jgi:hypothetical protein
VSSIDPNLLEYCRTDRQREILGLLVKLGSKRAVAKELGVAPHRVRQTLYAVEQHAATKGYSPRHDIDRPLPDHLMLTGTSTLVDATTGESRLQWVKSSLDRYQIREAMIAAANALASELTREKPTPVPCGTQDDLLSCYILTDFHLGSLSWAAETGADWDAQIAEDTIYNWASQAMKLVPKSRRAVFAQLGDFLHYDSLTSWTTENRNVLDSDSRYPRMVEIAVRALRKVIHMLLEHHEEVVILMAEGNHDFVGSVWLREMFAALYEDEPRIQVVKDPLPYYAVEHGSTSLFFHHGHLKRPKQVAETLAAQFRAMLGRTEFSYAHMGHFHHAQLYETPLMIVEQHETLSAPSSYDARGGWKSQRSAQVITYSKCHGEVSRIRIPFSLTQDEAA